MGNKDINASFRPGHDIVLTASKADVNQAKVNRSSHRKPTLSLYMKVQQMRQLFNMIFGKFLCKNIKLIIQIRSIHNLLKDF